MKEIKRVREESELLETQLLHEYSFQYTLSNDQRQSRIQFLQNNEVWGEYENEELQSKLNLLHHIVWIEGKEFNMGGIAGVATWPEHRRKGSVKRLLKQSLISMREQGMTISYLHPFEFSFYRQFGWEWISTLKEITFKREDLQFLSQTSGYIKRGLERDNIDLLNQLYEKYAKRYNGTLKRSAFWWDYSVLKGGFKAAAYFSDEGEATGYLLYKIENKELIVQEFIGLDHESRIGLWNFIAQHDSMVQLIKLELQEDDPLLYFLENPKVNQLLISYFMGRIVDVENFLRTAVVQSDEKLILHVTDSFAEWNEGTYEIFQGEVAKTALSNTTSGISMNIDTLTAWLLGARSSKVLWESRFITGNKDELDKWDQVRSNQPSGFFDYF